MSHSISLVEKYSYLIGQKINNWTILDIKQGEKQAMALCRCDCGTTKTVRVLNILYGLSKDCGCGRKKMLRRTRTKDIIGQKFGKLTALELLEDSNQFNRRMYRCKCDCGNETIQPSSSLISGHTKSCGCLVSYYNMFIDQLLTQKHITHICEYSVSIGESKYRFDFYLPDYNLFIEYDGEQHYKVPRYVGDNNDANIRILKNTQIRDEIKNKYCEDNGINLLRIPYWESKNIEEIIDNHLQRLNEKELSA